MRFTSRGPKRFSWQRPEKGILLMTGNEKIKHFRIQPELFVLHKESFFLGKRVIQTLPKLWDRELDSWSC